MTHRKSFGKWWDQRAMQRVALADFMLSQAPWWMARIHAHRNGPAVKMLRPVVYRLRKWAGSWSGRSMVGALT